MKRKITIEMYLTDSELARIVPSVQCWIEITAGHGDGVEGKGEILKVEDESE